MGAAAGSPCGSNALPCGPPEDPVVRGAAATIRQAHIDNSMGRCTGKRPSASAWRPQNGCRRKDDFVGVPSGRLWR
eukprot:1797971-Alexandrium_andersonii.AAC.1